MLKHIKTESRIVIHSHLNLFEIHQELNFLRKYNIRIEECRVSSLYCLLFQSILFLVLCFHNSKTSYSGSVSNSWMPPSRSSSITSLSSIPNLVHDLIIVFFVFLYSFFSQSVYKSLCAGYIVVSAWSYFITYSYSCICIEFNTLFNTFCKDITIRFKNIKWKGSPITHDILCCRYRYCRLYLPLFNATP